MDYENFLKTLSIKELKTLIKKYTSHVKILVTKKTKSQLIEHLLMHTELKNNKVVTKKIDIGDLPEKTKKEEIKKDEKKKLSKDESELLRQEYGDFIPSKEIIEKDIKENKERVKSNAETEKKKIYSIIKDFSDKEEWKKTTKQEKQLVCSSIYSFIHNYKDKEILKNLPSHLYDYFYKYCEEAKNDKTINKLKEMTNKEETKKEEEFPKLIKDYNINSAIKNDIGEKLSDMVHEKINNKDFEYVDNVYKKYGNVDFNEIYVVVFLRKIKNGYSLIKYSIKTVGKSYDLVFLKKKEITKKEETKKEEMTKKDENYKLINSKMEKLIKEQEEINNILKKDPQPTEKSMSFQEGKKIYGSKVKSKVQLFDLLREEYSKQLKQWREKNKKYLDRLDEIQKEKDYLRTIMPEDIGFSFYYISRIEEASQMLLRYLGRGVLDPYEKTQVKYYNDSISKNTEELQKYYPEKVKEIMAKK